MSAQHESRDPHLEKAVNRAFQSHVTVLICPGERSISMCLRHRLDMMRLLKKEGIAPSAG